MKAITLITLLWVVAIMLVSSWRQFIRSAAVYEVERTNRQYQEAIEREVGK